MDTGDIDGDGVQEIVANTTLSTVSIRIYSAVSRSVRWDIPSSNCCGGTTDLRVADVDGDNRAEVLMGRNVIDGIAIWKFDTGTQTFSVLASLPSQDYEVTGIAVGNLDGDTNPEVIWATVSCIPGRTSWWSANSPERPRWRSRTSKIPGKLDGPFYGGLLTRTGASTHA